MSSFLEALFLILVIIHQYIITIAQSEERFYFFGFENQSYWTVENEGTGTGLDWGFNSNACTNSIYLHSEYCLRMSGQGLISTIISTEGYHDIRLILGIPNIHAIFVLGGSSFVFGNYVCFRCNG